MNITGFLLGSTLVGSLIITLPLSAFARDDNTLEDGSFEMQLPAGEGGWTPFDQSRFSSKHARSGEWSMFNWGFSRTVPFPPYVNGTVSGSFQERAAEPGSRWRLTGYGMSPDGIKGPAAMGILQVSFFDEEGNDLGTVETDDDDQDTPKAKTSNQVNAKAAAGEWVMLDTGVVTAPANTAKIHAFTLFIDYSTAEVSQGVYFDDLKLCALGDEDDEDTPCE